MSKASRQSISLLAFINGAFITIDSYKLREDLTPTIDWGCHVCKECINKFPETGNSQKNFKRIQEKFKIAEKFLGEDAGNLYTAIVLNTMSELMITALWEKIKDPKKLELLQPVMEAVHGLQNQLDPKGVNFDAYDEANVYVEKIFKLIEFSRE